MVPRYAPTPVNSKPIVPAATTDIYYTIPDATYDGTAKTPGFLENPPGNYAWDATVNDPDSYLIKLHDGSVATKISCTATVRYYLGNKAVGTPISGSPTDPGTYYLEIVVSSPSAFKKGYAFTITPKWISITAPALQSNYGDPLPIDAVVSSDPDHPAVITWKDALGRVIQQPRTAGSYTYTASVPATKYNYSKTVTNTLTIAPLSEPTNFQFDTQSAIYTGQPISLSCTTVPAGLAYQVKYRGSTIPPTAVGSYSVTAQITDPNVSGATVISGTFTIVAQNQSQTIGDFTPIPSKVFGTAPFTITAPAATSGLPVTLSVSGPALIDNSGTLTLNGPGTVIVTASQAGNAVYGAAPNVSVTFEVLRRPQSLGSFLPIPDLKFGSDPFILTAPSSVSGLDVLVSVLSGPASIDPATNLLTLTGAGTVILRATQDGNSLWAPAAAVTTLFKVLKADQQIVLPHSFTNSGVNTIDLASKASSGLPIAFELQSGPATLSGSVLTITGTGVVSLTAFQDGDANYQPAQSVDFQVSVAYQSSTGNSGGSTGTPPSTPVDPSKQFTTSAPGPIVQLDLGSGSVTGTVEAKLADDLFLTLWLYGSIDGKTEAITNLNVTDLYCSMRDPEMTEVLAESTEWSSLKNGGYLLYIPLKSASLGEALGSKESLELQAEIHLTLESPYSIGPSTMEVTSANFPVVIHKPIGKPFIPLALEVVYIVGPKGDDGLPGTNGIDAVVPQS